MSTATEQQLRQAQIKIAERFLLHWPVYGERQTITGWAVCRDGSARRSVVAAMVRRGYLKDNHKRKRGSDDHMGIRSLVLDDLPEDKPDLARFVTSDDCGIRDVEATRRQGAVAWSQLTTGERLYVYRHRSAYRFAIADRWTRGKFCPVTAGVYQAEVARYSFQSYLLVSTPEFARECASKVSAAHIETLAAQNLSWGLRQVLGWDKFDSEQLRSDQRPCPLGTRGAGVRVTGAPETWAAQLDKELESARETIRLAEQRIAVLSQLERDAHNHGGWHKFICDYREALTTAVENNPDDE